MKANTQVKQVQKELETLNAKVKDLETKKQKLEEELNARQGEIDQILARLALGEVEEESKVQREIRERQEHLREIEDRLRAFNLALEELSRRIEEKKKELKQRRGNSGKNRPRRWPGDSKNLGTSTTGRPVRRRSWAR